MDRSDAGSATKKSPKGEGQPRQHFKTEGEKRFNFLTYTGLGYFANVGISLGSVYWAERWPSGQSFIAALGRGFKKLGFKSELGEFLGRKSFFLAGGFAVIPFIKKLEDDKLGHVKRYNREIYGAAAETDPTIVESEYEVATAAKQSWSSIISGRLLALVPFYATVGLLWDRASPLGKATNPEFAAMSKPAWAKLQKTDPQRYAEIAGKGIYLDRPISNFSRDFGKLISSRGTYFDAKLENASAFTGFYRGAMSLAGKLMRFLPEDRAVIARIEQMQRESPGELRSMTNLVPHDPNHSTLPYYFISEAITSAMVAWGLFVITRVTGPFFDRHPKNDVAPPEVILPEKPNGRPKMEIDTRDSHAEKLMTAPSLAIAAR